MPTTEQDLPCLQNPRSYQGQSLILDSGSMCRNGHSLLLHSPARGQHRHNTLKEYTWSKYSHRAHLWNTEPTDQTWSRSSIQASWSCRIHGETRTGLPSCTVLWASAYTPPSSLHWCDDTDTSHLGVETTKKNKKKVQHGRWHIFLNSYPITIQSVIAHLFFSNSLQTTATITVSIPSKLSYVLQPGFSARLTTSCRSLHSKSFSLIHICFLPPWV